MPASPTRRTLCPVTAQSTEGPQGPVKLVGQDSCQGDPWGAGVQEALDSEAQLGEQWR